MACAGKPSSANQQILTSLPLPVTIRVYLGSICAMFAAVYVSQLSACKRPFLGNILAEQNMQNATIGCLVTGMFVVVLVTIVPVENGSWLSALSQVDRFLPMAIILGVIYQIQRVGNKQRQSAGSDRFCGHLDQWTCQFFQRRGC